MRRVGLWQVAEDGPKKLKASGIDLEKHLEDWIARDPSLLQVGLKVVGRQITVEGGQLDLLALDPEGRWVVIELKSGAVRRDTIAQALDYASCVATMPYNDLSQKVNAYLKTQGTSLQGLLGGEGAEEDAESREVVMFVVGTGRDPGLERMAEYLSGTFGVPINVVSYEVFELEDGQRVLVRELTESEGRPPVVRRTVEEICALADQAGVAREFRTILEAAERRNLQLVPYKRRVRCAPPTNRTRTLFTVQATPTAGSSSIWTYVESGAFAEFYPVTEERATSILGPPGWRKMTISDVEAFVKDLDCLLESVHQAE
jgi:Holliday junction resolvase-like predicted endonuclease